MTALSSLVRPSLVHAAREGGELAVGERGRPRSGAGLDGGATVGLHGDLVVAEVVAADHLVLDRLRETRAGPRGLAGVVAAAGCERQAREHEQHPDSLSHTHTTHERASHHVQHPSWSGASQSPSRPTTAKAASIASTSVVVAVELLGRVEHRVAEVLEVRVGLQVLGHGAPDDLLGLVAADADDDLEVGVVGDAAVGVHAAPVAEAVVRGGAVVVDGHRLAEVLRVLVVADRAAVAVLAVRRVGGVEVPGHDVGDRLVQGTRLALVLEAGGVRGHAVGELVGGGVERVAGAGSEVHAVVAPVRRGPVVAARSRCRPPARPCRRRSPSRRCRGSSRRRGRGSRRPCRPARRRRLRRRPRAPDRPGCRRSPRRRSRGPRARSRHRDRRRSRWRGWGRRSRSRSRSCRSPCASRRGSSPGRRR